MGSWSLHLCQQVKKYVNNTKTKTDLWLKLHSSYYVSLKLQPPMANMYMIIQNGQNKKKYIFFFFFFSMPNFLYHSLNLTCQFNLQHGFSTLSQTFLLLSRLNFWRKINWSIWISTHTYFKCICLYTLKRTHYETQKTVWFLKMYHTSVLYWKATTIKQARDTRKWTWFCPALPRIILVLLVYTHTTMSKTQTLIIMIMMTIDISYSYDSNGNFKFERM